MTKITAKVEGNIPAHRLLWLYVNDVGDEMLIGLPKERGNYVDFVSTGELQDGQEVTVNIANNPVWIVEASTSITIGSNVAVNTDGRVGAYTSAPVRIGYSLDKAEPGELVRIVRNPKVYFHNLDLSILDGTVEEVKNNVNGLSKENLSQLLESEKQDKNRKSVVEHIESLLEGK